MKFCIFWRLKFTKLTKSRASKRAKTVILELLHSRKLISRKIWVIGKSWNFTNVNHWIHCHLVSAQFWQRVGYTVFFFVRSKAAKMSPIKQKNWVVLEIGLFTFIQLFVYNLNLQFLTLCFGLLLLPSHPNKI